MCVLRIVQLAHVHFVTLNTVKWIICASSFNSLMSGSASSSHCLEVLVGEVWCDGRLKSSKLSKLSVQVSSIRFALAHFGWFPPLLWGLGRSSLV